MLLFSLPFSVANEVVKRTRQDNRRIAESPVNGGNNFFYLGSPQQFIDKFHSNLKAKIETIKTKCEQSNTTLQIGEGIKTKHFINKNHLVGLIPFINSYLNQYSQSYHNPHFNSALVKSRLDAIVEDDLVFYSDLTFIKDANQAKPYFKWFTSETIENFKLAQEFLIPKMSFLNFDYLGIVNNEILVRWILSYTDTVIYSSPKIEEIVDQSIDKLNAFTKEQKETIKDAIIKIRIGQSQFRDNLLSSEKNSCLFTKISDPNLLIASHIKPWKNSSNAERLDKNNGILLSPTFDKLFDKFLITFDNNGRVLWSQKRLSDETLNLLKKGIEDLDNIVVNIDNTNNAYLDFHRTRFIELENPVHLG